MERKIASEIMLTILFISTLTLSINIQQAETTEPPATEWNKTYGGGADEDAWSMVQTLEGGYALAGYTESFGAGGKDFYLVKTDSSGNMEWNKTYGGVEDDSGRAMVGTLDGGYAIVGDTFSFAVGMWDFWLVKVDSSGNHEWNKTYGGAGIDSPFSMVQTSDGGYALAGFTHSFGAGNRDFYLVKTDSSGNMEWNKTYGGTNYDAAYAGVIQRGDGGYTLAGVAYSFGAGTWDFWLVKVDSSGNHEWNKTYGGANDDFAYSMIQTSDGGYALAGYTMSFGAGSTDFWLVKTNSSGNMEWNQTYGGGSTDLARSVVQTSDGGYAIAGSSGADFWLVKVAGGPVRNLDTGQTYQTIQEAINNASEGDRIYVLSGKYYENPVVNKTISLIGESKFSTIIDGGDTGNVVNVTAGNVNICGFTIQNSGSNVTDRGIHVSSNSNNISHNMITDNMFGIYLDFSSNNIVTNNNVSNNNQGIHLIYSHNNTLVGNTVSNNTFGDQVSAGIILRYSDNNNVTNNIVNNNGIAGAYNGMGIWLLFYCDYNIIVGNNLSSNSREGICLDYRCYYNNVSGNNVLNSNWGIYLIQEIASNTIVGNTVSGNTYGIYLYDCSNNMIFHNNFIDNTNQVYVEPGCANTWDDDYPSGGNYWSDHNPQDIYSGPYQNETGRDKIGDDAHIIDGYNTDRYPLIYPYGYVPSPDFNGDGTVNILDAIRLASVFGSKPGDPYWNPIIDINQDGSVNILDAIILAGHFGETV